jgi:uncharacterized protein YdeI (YjbR/CyaY-like superfamily)
LEYRIDHFQIREKLTYQLMASIEITELIYPKSRDEWRQWLSVHFEIAGEVWVATPKKNKPITYNDIIEEALCFNWIDSTLKTLDANHTAQRMSPRKSKAGFSQLNIERIRLILSQGLVHPNFKKSLQTVADTPFSYPEDILSSIRQNSQAWDHFQSFSEAYKRLRVSSVEAARKDPVLFKKRLITLVSQCIQNKKVAGSAGMEKYY